MSGLLQFGQTTCQVIPGMVVRAFVYTCKCGTIETWENEAQPSGSSHWQKNIELLRQSGTDVAFFNGDKPLGPDFVCGG